MIHFQRLATQCLLVRNTVKCPQFTSSTYNLNFYLNFVTTPAFFPIIDGVLFVAILIARDQSTATLFSTPRKELKISLAIVVSIIGTNPSQELLSDKQSLINATNRYGYLCNVCAFIKGNRKHNKRLDTVLQLAV